MHRALRPSACLLAAAASDAAILTAGAPAEAICAAPADAGTAPIDPRTIEVAAAPMPVTPVAPPAGDILNRIALRGLGLDCLTGSAREGGRGRKLRRYGCAGRDSGGEDKSFQSHVSLLDIDCPACGPRGLRPSGEAQGNTPSLNPR